LRSRCQRKLAYGCGIPLAGTYSIPPLPELSAEPKSSAASSCRLNQGFLEAWYADKKWKRMEMFRQKFQFVVKSI